MATNTKANVAAAGAAFVLSSLAFAVMIKCSATPERLCWLIPYCLVTAPSGSGLLVGICITAGKRWGVAEEVIGYSLGFATSMLGWFLLARAIAMRVAHKDYARRPLYTQIAFFALIWLLGAFLFWNPPGAPD